MRSQGTRWLEPHTLKEERVLVPAIRALLGGTRDFSFGTVRNPISVMMAEHDQAGALLALLRTATGGYTVPDDGCANYRSLYARLEHLEADTHLQIHLENNVLFPAALALEADEGVSDTCASPAQLTPDRNSEARAGSDDAVQVGGSR